MSNHGETFKVYPRGFLGATLADRVDRERRLVETNTGFAPEKFSVYKRPTDISEFNRAVEKIYVSYVRQEPHTNSFGFREQVLRAALTAFGTSNFHAWYKLQIQSPVLGRLHRDFLDDTLRFITEGRRDMTLETWGSLIDIENADAGTVGISDYAREYFGSNRPDPSVIDVVQEWCSKPNGLEDLLGTLHILFGQH